MAAASLLLQTGEEDEQHRARLPPLPHPDRGTLRYHLVHVLGEAAGETANQSTADILTSCLNIAGSESTNPVAHLPIIGVFQDELLSRKKREKKKKVSSKQAEELRYSSQDKTDR